MAAMTDLSSSDSNQSSNKSFKLPRIIFENACSSSDVSSRWASSLIVGGGLNSDTPIFLAKSFKYSKKLA